MRVILVKNDDLVIVDNVGRKVQLDGLPEPVHVIVWDSEQGKGHIQFHPELQRTHEEITDFGPYQQYIDDWDIAVPDGNDVIDFVGPTFDEMMSR